MNFPEPLIRIEEVWKTYGAISTVCGLNLKIPPRSIYGFLGPNGAGKSTTIRMVLGLQRPSSGAIFLFGRPLATERTALLRRIGSLVEAPSLYLHLTGEENLEVHRRMLGASKQAIPQALETVGLLSAARQIVRKYSSGMKQRLGLAQALLGEPDLLILDEPTNGLDPTGIHEMRTLIRSLPDRHGVTVFLSSHLLSEMEQVTTHLAIISQGRLRFEGTPEELRKKSKQTVAIDVDQPDRADAMLRAMGCRFTRTDSHLLIENGQYEPQQLNAMFVNAGMAVSHLAVQHPTLEQLFLELTQDQ